MKLSKEDQSLLAIGVGFSVIALLTRNYYFFIPVGIALISFPFFPLKKIVHRGWHKVGEIAGWVSQRIILFVLFFIFLVPIAFIRKLFGKDPLLLNSTRRTTTFISRNHTYTPGDLKNPW